MSHVEPRAVVEHQAGDVAVAEHGARAARQMRLDAEAIHRRSQHRARRVVELHLHQVAHQVHDVHLDVELQQAARGLEAEQAAADHRGAARDAAAYSRIAEQSSSVRNTKTPGAVAARVGDAAPRVAGRRACCRSR